MIRYVLEDMLLKDTEEARVHQLELLQESERIQSKSKKKKSSGSPLTDKTGLSCYSKEDSSDTRGEGRSTDLSGVETDSWCRSSLGDKASTKYTWIIEDFTRRPSRVGEVLSSETFSVTGPGIQDIQWRLQMYPEGRRDDTKDYVAVYLKSENIFPVRASFTLYVLNGQNQKECVSRVCEEICSFQPMNSERGTRWGDTEFIEEDKFEDPDFLTAAGELKVVCELTVYGPEKTFSGSQTQGNVKQVGEDLWNLYELTEMSDVVINVVDETFLCHKLVLAARSPVFKAMFQVGTRECEIGKVYLSDLSSAAFKHILQFIYRGTLPAEDIDNDMWKELKQGAEKLQLDLLKRMCEERLDSDE